MAWWYNRKTGEVEDGPQSLGGDRYGPFDTKDEAERAPEIIRGRAAAWEAEEREER